MNAYESLVEDQLAARGWLATDNQPCLAVAHADENLPFGWVRISDDCATLAIGPAAELAVQIAKMPEGTDYDNAFAGMDEEAPNSSRDWPAELCDTEALEEGTPNDNPNTLFVLATNAGIRYAAGPTGANCCGLSDWLRNDSKLATSREQAIAQGCEFSQEEEVSE